MLTNEGHDAIVRSTIDLARNLRLRAVAEGVEDEATWRRLGRLGCDAGQGYYLSPPLRGRRTGLLAMAVPTPGPRHPGAATGLRLVGAPTCREGGPAGPPSRSDVGCVPPPAGSTSKCWVGLSRGTPIRA